MIEELSIAEDVPRVLDYYHEKPEDSKLEEKEDDVNEIFSNVENVSEIYRRCIGSEFG